MNGRCARLRSALTSAALAILPFASLANAQTANMTEASGAAGASTDVQEIIVTATRREQTLSKVPESITAFSAATMDVQGVKSFADLAKFTPGVTFDESSHDIAIRGISSTAGSGTTGLYVDDTPIQMRALGFNANNALPAVFDLDRVEILRGPQGTLFGAGSEGGAVRYITTQPSLTKFSAYGHAEVADTEGGAISQEAGVAVGGPIVKDTLGFRLSAWTRRDGGWIDRVDYRTGATTSADANRVDTIVLRAALKWAPTSALSVAPAFNYQNRVQNNYDRYWVSISDPAAGRFASGTPDRMADPDRFYMPSLKVEYVLGSVKFVSDTSYYDRREVVNGYSGTLYNLSYFQQLTGARVDPQGDPCAQCATDPNPLLLPGGPNLPGFGDYVAQNFTTNSQQNYTEELRIENGGPDARLSWVAGLFFEMDAQRSTEEIRDPQLPALTQYLWGESMLSAWGQALVPNGNDYINDTRSHDRQEALFFDGAFNFTNRTKITAGLRYSWTHFDFVNMTNGAQDVFDNGGRPRYASGSKNERPFTPKLGLTYQISKNDLLYATFSEGYRIGGATPPLPVQACGGTFPSSYKSDTVTNFEIGSKDRAFDGRLEVAASAYMLQWRNIQQSFTVPVCGVQYTANAGNAISQGFDLQGRWRASDALLIDLSVGFTDARFSTDAVSATGAVLARKGDALNAAPWTVAVGAQYRFSFLGHDAFLRVDDEFDSHRTRPIPAEDRLTSYYDPGLVADPATNQLSFRGGQTVGGWQMDFFVDNVLDAHPRLNLSHQDKFTLLYEAQTFRPRTIGLSLSSRY